MWTRLWQAAPGVQMASPEEIQKALSNPETTVIDARTIEEMQKDGYFNASTCRFLHAPATKTEAPLLQLAAKSLLPKTDAPVVIYCGSGIRATTSKQVLEEAGYTNVLNAGGLSDIQALAKA
jgi:phage shock protein E